MKRALSAGVLLLALSLPAAAISLEEAIAALGSAKASGQLGEQPDGYLGVVQPSGQAAAVAARINQARQAEYQRVASQNGIGLKAVESLAGQKAIARTPAGQYIQQGGRWVRK